MNTSLNGIATFTSQSSRGILTLPEHLLRKIPSFGLTGRSLSSCLVNIVDEHRVLNIEYFEDIEMQDAWSANEIMAAIRYKKFLRKLNQSSYLSCFLQCLFLHIFCIIYCKQNLWM